MSGDADDLMAALFESRLKRIMARTVTITYDEQTHVAYVYLFPTDTTTVRTQALEPAVNVDYNASGYIVGIKLLGVDRPEVIPGSGA